MDRSTYDDIVARTLAVARVAFFGPLFPPRRYEYSCLDCHQGNYPRLNSFGRQFRENGYQLPRGAEDATAAHQDIEPGTRAESLSVLRTVPLSVRAQVYSVTPVTAPPESTPAYEAAVFGFLFGGGRIGKDLSAYFPPPTGGKCATPKGAAPTPST